MLLALFKPGILTKEGIERLINDCKVLNLDPEVGNNANPDPNVLSAGRVRLSNNLLYAYAIRVPASYISNKADNIDSLAKELKLSTIDRKVRAF